jgi:hypothetical protein
MVVRLGFAEKTLAEDTNIDQSILADLYNTRHDLKPNSQSMKSMMDRMIMWFKI